MQLRSPTASKGNQLALSGGNYDHFDNFRLFGMAGSGQDTGETLGYKRRDLSAQVQKKKDKNLFNKRARRRVEKEAQTSAHI